jgi:hypothetical protein
MANMADLPEQVCAFALSSMTKRRMQRDEDEVGP